jgi:hypothetical protein
MSKFLTVAKSDPETLGGYTIAPYHSKPLKVPKYKVLRNKPNLKAIADHRHSQLFHMLTYMRPELSAHEQRFCDRYIAPVAGWQDDFGNYHRIIASEAKPTPAIMFCCHTDSVHSLSGFQNLEYDAENDIVSAKNSSCLGADDATGVYILLQMIKAGVPGHYIFHRSEEVGGLGSKWVSLHTPEIFKDINMAVSFDRKGTSEIIADQCVGKCASTECASAMSIAFSDVEKGLFLLPSEEGVYTDTAEYVDLVPECFNISVGYYNEHTSKEYQKLGYLTSLINACTAIDWEALPIVRKEGDMGLELLLGGSQYGTGSSSFMATKTDLMALMVDCPEALAEYMVRLELLTYDDVNDVYDEYDNARWIERDETF